MDKKGCIYTALFLAFLLAAFYRNWNGSLGLPPSGQHAAEALDIYSPPSTEKCEEEEIARGDEIKIVKRLRISLDAVVRNESGPPFFTDLVEGKYSLTWGEANREDVQKHVKWAGAGFSYQNTEEATRAASVVNQHRSNFYLIASNANLRKAVSRIGEGDHIRIRGYLADVTHPEGTWTTKPPLMVRNDICNLVYLEELQIENTVYR